MGGERKKCVGKTLKTKNNNQRRNANIVSGYETNDFFFKKLHSLASNRDSRSPFICALLAFWQCYVAFYRHAGFVDNVCFLLRKEDSTIMTFIQSVLFCL